MEIIERKPDNLKEKDKNTEINTNSETTETKPLDAEFGPDYEKQFKPVQDTKAPVRFEVTKKTVIRSIITFLLYFLMFVLTGVMMGVFQAVNKDKNNLLSKVTTKEESFFRQIKKTPANVGIYKIKDVVKIKEFEKKYNLVAKTFDEYTTFQNKESNFVYANLADLETKYIQTLAEKAKVEKIANLKAEDENKVTPEQMKFLNEFLQNKKENKILNRLVFFDFRETAGFGITLPQLIHADSQDRKIISTYSNQKDVKQDKYTVLVRPHSPKAEIDGYAKVEAPSAEFPDIYVSKQSRLIGFIQKIKKDAYPVLYSRLISNTPLAGFDRRDVYERIFIQETVSKLPFFVKNTESELETTALLKHDVWFAQKTIVRTNAFALFNFIGMALGFAAIFALNFVFIKKDVLALRKNWLVLLFGLGISFGITIVGNAVAQAMRSGIDNIYGYALSSNSLNQQTIETAMQGEFKWFLIFTVCVFGPIIEELVFRKAIFALFKVNWPGVVISTVVFAAIHVVKEPSFTLFSYNLFTYLVGGLAFSLVYVYSKRNVVVTSVLHMLHNTLAVLLFFLS